MKTQMPAADQYVDECPFSKTGWAIWNKKGGCTCAPAKAPSPLSPSHRAENNEQGQ